MLGTAFLRCPEAKTHPAWANALQDLEPEGTTLTRALTGRLGRAIATDFVNAAAVPEAPRPAPYPIQRGLTAMMKEAGAAAGNYHRMQVWAGQSAAMAKPIPAGDLAGPPTKGHDSFQRGQRFVEFQSAKSLVVTGT